MSEQPEPPQPTPAEPPERVCCGRLRGRAGKPLAVAGALVAGALFWATYRRFVQADRRDERSGD
jgi:hypothetical protein